ncbi:sulfatase family protein [Crateriforma conspicua]|nr:sulfatase [Crateriforma conspicua]
MVTRLNPTTLLPGILGGFSLWISLAGSLVDPLGVSRTASAEDRINVVWIIADDLGPELGCYGYPSVQTPNIDRLAHEGRRYTHAFATAPVCSSSRTAFQTGHYQTTVGGHHHITRDKQPLPDGITTVTQQMQKAGYFVCNGSGKADDKKFAKSHLNFQYKPQTFFDGVDWSQRTSGQPFFAQVQIKEPHRTFVHRDHEYANVPIPPYYPDHPITRADWGNYLASIEVLDRKVGAVLKRLDDEGLTDNTLVIFTGDHGRPHVRAKQWLYEGGLHVPLILRWPGRIAAKEVSDDLVSLLDLMPTTLTAAGADVPELPGINLLDPDTSGHDVLFAARDRCGDAIDRIRSARTKNFKYIRNFHPELPYMQHSGYKRLQYPVDTLMRVLHQRGEFDSPFMADRRPAEELYDLRTDPHEQHNLADDPRYATQLIRLRQSVDQWIVRTDDQGRFDESVNVDMDALMKEKRRWYEQSLRKRGLDPGLSDEEFLQWWDEYLHAEPSK